MKCREIKMLNNITNKWEIIPVNSVFYLATIPKDLAYGNNKQFHGINIGIAIPHDNQKEFEKFIKDYNIFSNPIIYLLGDNNEKIPVIYCDGYAYDEKCGTSCAFVYVIPDIIASDIRPDV